MDICCTSVQSIKVKQASIWLSLKVFVVLCVAEQVVQELLRVLCSADMTPREHLETQQALFKQFAEILDFVLRFDDLKVG
jgi:hypothetical protein